ncbi:PhnD/SsuA/transferrin family substrate-binding protein [Verrucomicrobiales bacterium BCK34]|nr:PhnD/SsuA/transferrin family substrate-binding protein [Verrucomicrobiales bacterium BCK34]
MIARLVLLLTISSTLFVACSDSGTNGEQGKTAADVSSEAATRVVFGVYTADKASDVVKEFAPAISWLEKTVSESLGRPVDIQMKIANSYLAGISDIAIGEVHFSRLGPASYIHAMDENSDLEILAMESKKGKRSFKGLIVVHEDSEIQSIEELKGKSFAFGSPLSTIGRYLSQDILISKGIHSADLSQHAFLGRHDSVGMAVAAKAFDAGALKSSSFDALIEEGYPLRTLVAFDNVTKPWIAHPDLDPEVAEALKRAMLEITPEQADEIGIDGFVESGPQYYEETGAAMIRSKQFGSSLTTVSQ